MPNNFVEDNWAVGLGPGSPSQEFRAARPVRRPDIFFLTSQSHVTRHYGTVGTWCCCSGAVTSVEAEATYYPVGPALAC